MGQNSSANGWTVNDVAFGTGENMVTLDEAMHETRKLQIKAFGGKTIEADPSIQDIQKDLLSIDDSLKRLVRKVFRRKSRKTDKSAANYEEEIDYEEEYYEEIDQETREQGSKDIQSTATYATHSIEEENEENDGYAIPHEILKSAESNKPGEKKADCQQIAKCDTESREATTKE